MRRNKGAYLEFLHSLLASGTGTGYLDEISRVGIDELVGVSWLPDVVVRARAGELHLSASAVLELSEVLATATDESTMLNGRDRDAEDDTVTEVGDDFLKLGFDLGHKFGLTTQVNFVASIARTRA